MINMHKTCDTIKNINESSLTFGAFSIALGFVATGKTITKSLVAKNRGHIHTSHNKLLFYIYIISIWWEK